MRVSCIIPTFNEVDRLPILKQSLQDQISSPDSLEEVIVVDGCSDDHTAECARSLGWTCIESGVRRRSVQMNKGAAVAKGEILYFVHADSQFPSGFDHHIKMAVQSGKLAGCFRLKFDVRHSVLSLFAWFTRFSGLLFRGGDQSLFVDKALFKRLNGFDESMSIMEEYQFIRRLRRHTRFTILAPRIVTSARKYNRNGIIRLQLIFAWLHLLYAIGMKSEKLNRIYRKFVK